MKPDIFLPYGLNNKEEIVHVSEVESGQTNLTCPFCTSSLVAKKGPRLTHHFAHAQNTCKEVAKGDTDRITPSIPFYRDFFSANLSESEKQAISILYKRFGVKLFHRKGKTDSAFHLLFQNDISRISQVWENLLSAKLIQQRGNWYHLTKNAELGLVQVLVAEFAEIQAQRLHFFEAFLETGTSTVDILRKKVFDNLKTRILYASLYCLHIPGAEKEADVWKIGITTRTATHRLQELLPVLKHHFGLARANATYIAIELPRYGRLEAYIKKRFAAANYPVSYKTQVYTEFFTDPQLLAELQLLSD